MANLEAGRSPASQSAEGVSRAAGENPGQSEGGNGSLRTSLSSSSTPILRTLDRVGNATLVSRIAAWWKDTATPTLPALSVTKESAHVDNLNNLNLLGLITHLEDRSQPSLTSTSPSWQRKDFSDTMETPDGLLLASLNSHNDPGYFIRADISGQAQELKVELHLTQAKISWLDRDFQSMFESAAQALELSGDIGFPKYTAKICFYVAIAYMGNKDFAKGYEFLELAEQCKGIFREGELIDWARKEAAFYENRVTTRSVPIKENIEGKPGATLGRASDDSLLADSGIPGRRWQPAGRGSSSSSYVAATTYHYGSDSTSKVSRQQKRSSPESNWTSLAAELQDDDGYDE